MKKRLLATILVIGVAAGPVQRGLCAADELKVTPEMEDAVRRGLDYLARTQQADGSWPGRYGKVSGVVGLAMMAFLAHGEMPDESKYGPVIRKAVDYILKTQASNGLLSGGGSPMYSHGFATLALAEVYGMIDDPRVGPALKKAVGLIVSSQKKNPHGAWRYSVNSTSADTTVSGAQMVALRAAANAGIEVPTNAIKRGVAFYKKCFSQGGGFGYTGPGGSSVACAGIGLLVLSLSGEYKSPEVRATAEWLLARGIGQRSGHFYYSSYYCSQAMFQAGGKYWRTWNEAMTPMLLQMQSADGSWTTGGSTGPVFNTAAALLSIEINYNFLPIYQR